MEFFKFKLFHQVKHVLDNETIDLNFVYPLNLFSFLKNKSILSIIYPFER